MSGPCRRRGVSPGVPWNSPTARIVPRPPSALAIRRGILSDWVSPEGEAGVNLAAHDQEPSAYLHDDLDAVRASIGN